MDSAERVIQLQQLLKQSPDDSFLKFALALEYIAGGKDQDALGLFHQIILHDPGYTGTYYHLGKLYERLNDFGSSKKIYEEGLRRTSANEPRAHAELQEALNALPGEHED